MSLLPADTLALARELVALRQAAEAELRALQALCPSHQFSDFERELVRTAFKAGASFGANRKEAQ